MQEQTSSRHLGTSRLCIGIPLMADDNHSNLRIQMAVQRYNSAVITPSRNSTNRAFFSPQPNPAFKYGSQHWKRKSCGEIGESSKNHTTQQYNGVGNFPTVRLSKISTLRKPVKRRVRDEFKLQTPDIPTNRLLALTPTDGSDSKTPRSVLDVLQDLSRKRIHLKNDGEEEGNNVDQFKGLGGDMEVDMEAPYKPLFVTKSVPSNNKPATDKTTQTWEASESPDVTKNDVSQLSAEEKQRIELRRTLARKNNEISASLSSSVDTNCAAFKRKRGPTMAVSNGTSEGRNHAKKLKLVTSDINATTSDTTIVTTPSETETEVLNSVEKQSNLKQKPTDSSPKSPPTRDRMMSIFLDMQDSKVSKKDLLSHNTLAQKMKLGSPEGDVTEKEDKTVVATLATSSSQLLQDTIPAVTGIQQSSFTAGVTIPQTTPSFMTPTMAAQNETHLEVTPLPASSINSPSVSLDKVSPTSISEVSKLQFSAVTSSSQSSTTFTTPLNGVNFQYDTGNLMMLKRKPSAPPKADDKPLFLGSTSDFFKNETSKPSPMFGLPTSSVTSPTTTSLSVLHTTSPLQFSFGSAPSTTTTPLNLTTPSAIPAATFAPVFNLPTTVVPPFSSATLFLNPSTTAINTSISLPTLSTSPTFPNFTTAPNLTTSATVNSPQFSSFTSSTTVTSANGPTLFPTHSPVVPFGPFSVKQTDSTNAPFSNTITTSNPAAVQTTPSQSFSLPTITSNSLESNKVNFSFSSTPTTALKTSNPTFSSLGSFSFTSVAGTTTTTTPTTSTTVNDVKFNSPLFTAAQTTSTASLGLFNTAPNTATVSKTFTTPTTTLSLFNFGSVKTTTPNFSLNTTTPTTTSSPFTFTNASVPTSTSSTFNFGSASTTQPTLNFGGSAKFGTQAVPSFGGSATQAVSPFSANGNQPATGFGASSNTSTFGSQASQLPSFGTSSQPTPSFGTSSTTFGTPGNQPSAFGVTNNPPAPTFGTPSSQTAPMFGTPSNQAASTFGSPNNQPMPTFGHGTNLRSTISFGGSSIQATPTFGVPSSHQTPTFGTSSSQPAPTFGGATSGQPTSTFGTPSSQPTPTFGTASSQSLPTFGSSNNPPASTFGVPSTQPAPNFGTTSNPTSPVGAFGGSTLTNSTFGTVTNQPAANFNFGTASTQPSVFPSSNTPFSFGTQAKEPFTFGGAKPSTQTAQPASKPVFSFGGTQPAAAPVFGFGSTSTESPASSFGTSTPFSATGSSDGGSVFSFGSNLPSAGIFGQGSLNTPNANQPRMFNMGSGSSQPRPRSAMRMKRRT